MKKKIEAEAVLAVDDGRVLGFFARGHHMPLSFWQAVDEAAKLLGEEDLVRRLVGRPVDWVHLHFSRCLKGVCRATISQHGPGRGNLPATLLLLPEAESFLDRPAIRHWTSSNAVDWVGEAS